MWYIPMKSRCLSPLQNRHNFASPRRLLLHCSAPLGDWFKRFFTSKDCELPLPRESADKMCLLIFETRVIVRCDRDWNSLLPSCAVSSPNHLLVKIETSRNPRDSYPSGSQQVLLHRFWTQQIPGGSCGTTVSCRKIDIFPLSRQWQFSLIKWHWNKEAPLPSGGAARGHGTDGTHGPNLLFFLEPIKEFGCQSNIRMTNRSGAENCLKTRPVKSGGKKPTSRS